jgi:type IV pilus assembly protein PilC
MAHFEYVARAPDGAVERGRGESLSESALLNQLRERGLLVFEIRPHEDEPVGSDALAGLARLFPPRRIDVEIELRQLAFLLRSGVPLLASLRACARQSTRRSMGEVWLDVARGVQGGATLTDSLARHRCFPRIVLGLVGVGEQTGELDTVLERAAEALERQRERASAVVTSMTYPTIVLVLATGTVAYLTLGLMPKLSGFLTGIGRQLPGPTRLLIDISAFVQTNLAAILAAVLTLLVFALVVWFSPLRRSLADPMLLRVPLVSSVLRLSNTASFAHDLSLMLASGLRLTSALRTVATVMTNHRFHAAVDRARERVLAGAPFSDALAAESGTFGPLVVSAVAVGESSGTLDTVLAHAAEFHDKRLRALIQRLGAIVEPVIVIVIGGIVGFVYVAFFMAIYAVAGTSS